MNMKRPKIRRSLSFVLCCGLALALLSGCASSEKAREAEDSSSEEEVSIGYGKQSKRDATGAISSVSSDDVKEQPVRSVEEMLIGRVSGVQVMQAPGGGIAVRIRGASSIYGSNEPLYVLDGFPITPGPGGALTGINPYDIESIDVLKDAASTAIYGSRGANGVIVITTRRGE